MPEKDAAPQRAALPGHAYHQVMGGFEIAKRIADLLEDYLPEHYTSMNRAQTVGWINDTLHDRSDQTIDNLIDLVKRLDNPDGHRRVVDMFVQLQLFNIQKATIPQRYGGPITGPARLRPVYSEHEPDAFRHVVTQTAYDRAVKNGFPSDFFFDAHIHSVNFYCVPENADFGYSTLSDCSFNVCAVRGAVFEKASLYSCHFQTVDLTGTRFEGCTLAHTHFNDVDLSKTDFQFSAIKNANITHCRMDDVNLLCTKLSEVSFAKIEAANIRNFSKGAVSFGAVGEDARQHRMNKMLAELNLPPGTDAGRAGRDGPHKDSGPKKGGSAR